MGEANTVDLILRLLSEQGSTGALVLLVYGFWSGKIQTGATKSERDAEAKEREKLGKIIETNTEALSDAGRREDRYHDRAFPGGES